MEWLFGYRRAVLVDAMVTGEHPPGTVRRFSDLKADVVEFASWMEVGTGIFSREHAVRHEGL